MIIFVHFYFPFSVHCYIIIYRKKEEYELFSDEDGETTSTPQLSYEQYQRLKGFLKKKDNPTLLPIQITYYTGLRIE